MMLQEEPRGGNEMIDLSSARERREPVTYLTAAETAKYVRKALKEAFPGQKFSVRSSTYSMGCSVDVSWTDGPTTDEVESVTDQFIGSGFDGTIDLAFNKTHWLLPDGTVQFASSQGSEGSMGIAPRVPLMGKPEGAVRVGFADHVMCQRRVSDEYKKAVTDEIAAKTGLPWEPSGEYEVSIDGRGMPWGRWANGWDVVHRISYAFRPDELETAMSSRRVSVHKVGKAETFGDAMGL